MVLLAVELEHSWLWSPASRNHSTIPYWYFMRTSVARIRRKKGAFHFQSTEHILPYVFTYALWECSFRIWCDHCVTELWIYKVIRQLRNKDVFDVVVEENRNWTRRRNLIAKTVNDNWNEVQIFTSYATFLFFVDIQYSLCCMT